MFILNSIDLSQATDLNAPSTSPRKAILSKIEELLSSKARLDLTSRRREAPSGFCPRDSNSDPQELHGDG